jgi:hypothetical protein
MLQHVRDRLLQDSVDREFDAGIERPAVAFHRHGDGQTGRAHLSEQILECVQARLRREVRLDHLPAQHSEQPANLGHARPASRLDAGQGLRGPVGIRVEDLPAASGGRDGKPKGHAGYRQRVGGGGCVQRGQQPSQPTDVSKKISAAMRTALTAASTATVSAVATAAARTPRRSHGHRRLDDGDVDDDRQRGLVAFHPLDRQLEGGHQERDRGVDRIVARNGLECSVSRIRHAIEANRTAVRRCAGLAG